MPRRFVQQLHGDTDALVGACHAFDWRDEEKERKGRVTSFFLSLALDLKNSSEFRQKKKWNSPATQNSCYYFFFSLLLLSTIPRTAKRALRSLFVSFPQHDVRCDCFLLHVHAWRRGELVGVGGSSSSFDACDSDSPPLPLSTSCRLHQTVAVLLSPRLCPRRAARIQGYVGGRGPWHANSRAGARRLGGESGLH